LFYRLSVVPIDIPALKERPEDIIPLAHRFLQEVNERYGFTRYFSGPIMERMLCHAWPGNVRELRNIVERLAVTTSADEIGPVAWPPEITAEPSAPWNATELKTTRVAHEVEAVRAAVERLGSIGRAAAHLGVSASTVKRRLRQGRQIIRH
jgi:transcriptional regulator with PAS, ATPase and Fis domain